MSSSIVDLRSDTVTKPTPAMRSSMQSCECDDDVFGTDPTVNQLEAEMAQYLGKESALFVPSGTMSNLIACLVHCSDGRMNEILLGDQSHIFLNEAAGVAALGGLQTKTLKNLPDGTFSLQELEESIRPVGNLHFPHSRLVCIESSHNATGGRAVGPKFIQSVSEICKKANLKLHLDGARLMNSCISLNIKASELVKTCDSVSFCLSKGLAAPVGSCLVGSKSFIASARHLRKQLGGGMRQAGILAACGLISLHSMIERLAEDHKRCQTLANEIIKLPGLSISQQAVETNIVYFDLNSSVFPDGFIAGNFVEKVAKEGILIVAAGKYRIRLVTHYMIDDDAVQRTISAFQKVIKESVKQ
jgi:threonine aldolase